MYVMYALTFIVAIVDIIISTYNLLLLLELHRSSQPVYIMNIL
jgi:hypothetical protein